MKFTEDQVRAATRAIARVDITYEGPPDRLHRYMALAALGSVTEAPQPKQGIKVLRQISTEARDKAVRAARAFASGETETSGMILEAAVDAALATLEMGTEETQPATSSWSKGEVESRELEDLERRVHRLEETMPLDGRVIRRY